MGKALFCTTGTKIKHTSTHVKMNILHLVTKESKMFKISLERCVATMCNDDCFHDKLDEKCM